ncbi:MAG TPA: hypothetical protein VJ021_08510 [Thermoplasmata archaeon]|nr:hypothetical protein [Thermoplasmata archaeon]
MAFRFFAYASTLNCLGCSGGVPDPGISLYWFCLLSALALMALGGAISRPLAAVGLVTTGTSALALWILVSYYSPEGYLTSPWWPGVPIDWVGAIMVIAVLARAVALSTTLLPRAASNPQQ